MPIISGGVNVFAKVEHSLLFCTVLAFHPKGIAVSRGPQPDAVEATKARIADAFLTLYEHTPLAQITVAQVCRQADVARTTFYRHYHNVEALFEAVVARNTTAQECRAIIDNVATIPLEEATDLIADFYDRRAEAVRILITGSEGARYLRAQTQVMVPLFRALIAQALDLTPMQLDYASEYVARAKSAMIALWVEKGQRISLNQISRMTENIIERDIWTAVARQTPRYDGPQARTSVERHRFDYPWTYPEVAPR